MNSQELISVYSMIANITNKMMAAAKSNNWALLAQLETHCSLYVQVVKENNVSVVLADEEREEKIHIINKILADDREIRDIIQPRLAKLSELMQRSSTQHKLARAYSLDQRQ